MFVGSCAGRFYALDRERGAERWGHDATLDGGHANFHGNVVFHEDLVVVGTDSGERGFLYAFDRATGKERWRQAAPGGFPSAIATADGRLYAVTMGGEVRCLDLDTGTLLWFVEGHEGERFLKSSILATGDRVVASLPSGEVFAIEAGSGEEIWRTRLPGRLNTSLVRIGGDLAVGDVQGRIHRLSLKKGKIEPVIALDGPVYGSLQAAGACLLALSAETTLTCLDPRSGEPRWSREAPSAWSSFEPLVLDGRVVVGDAGGAVHAYRLEDGAPAWTLRVEGEVKGLGEDGGTLYVGTVEGRVYALPLPTAESPPA